MLRAVGGGGITFPTGSGSEARSGKERTRHSRAEMAGGEMSRIDARLPTRQGRSEGEARASLDERRGVGPVDARRGASIPTLHSRGGGAEQRCHAPFPSIHHGGFHGTVGPAAASAPTWSPRYPPVVWMPCGFSGVFASCTILIPRTPPPRPHADPGGAEGRGEPPGARGPVVSGDGVSSSVDSSTTNEA